MKIKCVFLFLFFSCYIGNKNKIEKIKLIQVIQILDSDIKYSEIVNEVNQLKNKIILDLKTENLEDMFEIIIEVKNSRESICFNK